jgi:hypothetical protein
MSVIATGRKGDELGVLHLRDLLVPNISDVMARTPKILELAICVDANHSVGIEQIGISVRILIAIAVEL